MKLDINSAFTFVSLLFLMIGGTYRLAQIEANINARISKTETTLLNAIDYLKDNLSDTLHGVEKKLDIHLVEYQEKKVFIEYRLTGIEAVIKHKFERLANWIKQISDLLHKQFGFQITDDKF